MKKMLHGLVLMMALLFIHACGGGSSSTLDSLFIANPSTNIEKIDISDKEKTLLSKENILELFKMSGSYIPTDLEFSQSEYDILLSKSNKKTQACSSGGSMTLVTDAKNSKLAFGFDKCKIESITVDGVIDVTFEQRTENIVIGFYRGKDLNMTDGTNTYIYNYNIKFNNRHNISTKEYYIDVFHVEKNERTKINMTIDNDMSGSEIKGVYLLNNNTYFTLESKNSKRINVGVLSIQEENLFDRCVSGRTSNHAQIIIKGKNSEFVYEKTVSGYLYKVFDNNKTFYQLKDEDVWTEDVDYLIPNEHAPFLNISQENSFYHYKNYFITMKSNQSILVKISDWDSYINHKLILNLKKKPTLSQLQIDNQEILLNYYSEDFNEVSFKNNINLPLDVYGKYEFELYLVNGTKEVRKEFTFEYHEALVFDEKTHQLDGEFANDIMFIASINSTAFLDTERKELLLIDENYNKNTISLPNKPSNMTLIPNSNTLAISADAKVFIVDFNTKMIIKQYDFSSVLGDIVAYNNYLYIIENSSGWSGLFSLNLATDSIAKLNSASYGKPILALNSNLNSLYIIDIGLSGNKIDKYDISNGNAIKPYESPYHHGYKFLHNLWCFSENKLLTAGGVMLSMSNIQAEDMQYMGRAEMLSLEINSYNSIIEKIAIYERSFDNSKILITRVDNEYRSQSKQISKNKILNRLDIYSDNNSLLFTKYLAQYYKDENGKKYRCFVEDAVFIGNNKVLVLYKANFYDSSWSSTVEDKFNFYQVIDVP